MPSESMTELISPKTLNSLEETEKFASNFIVWLLPAITSRGGTVALEGGLGAGKTTFVAALMKYLNPSEKVSSPTYVLEHQYQGLEGILIRHWDLYRIPSSAAPEELLEPLVPGELRLIEWASKSREISEAADVLLNFELISEFVRGCEIEVLPEGLGKGLSW